MEDIWDKTIPRGTAQANNMRGSYTILNTDPPWTGVGDSIWVWYPDGIHVYGKVWVVS